MATAQDDPRTLIAETPFPSAAATQCPYPLFEAFRRQAAPVYQVVQAIEDIDGALLVEEFSTNTIGPLRTVQGVLPNLRQGSKVAFVSRLDELTLESSGSWLFRTGERLTLPTAVFGH